MDAYKCYQPAMEWDASVGEWFGHVRDIADTITFRGATEAEATTSFRESVDDYLAWCAKDGNPPCLPIAGLDARRGAASTPETKRHALDNLKST